jgi:beta-mannosidase
MRLSVYRMLAAALLASPAPAARIWTVRLEEPTGIERRDRETVRVPLARLGGNRSGFRVWGVRGREVPWQVDGDSLLFPASAMGGEQVEYKVSCCRQQPAPPPGVRLAHMASGRIEMDNGLVRLVLDPASGRIVEAYNLTAGPARALNLVERTPDGRDPNDIHKDPPLVTGPASPVPGPNEGWGPLSGPVSLENAVLEAGPLAARVRAGSWSLEMQAFGPAVRWRATGGYRFASLSALPHMPFDRCVDGDEYRWPTGPGSGEPPESLIGPRTWDQPPGGLFAYYNRSENYGGLAIVPLADGLRWSGACTARFQAAGDAALALVFLHWRGDQTALEARSETRKLRQPLLLAEVAGPVEAPETIRAPLRSPPPPVAETVQKAPASWTPAALDLNGSWELAWGDKGAGPSSEWRPVQVPGSAHTQWLPPEQIYSPGAAWVSRKEWWYRRTIQVPAGFSGHRLRLEFDATDYFAEVFLDGRRIGRHEGYIDSYFYDVTGIALPGRQHELRVRVWTPVHYYWKHRPYTVKGSYGGVDQKPDDITALGITRGVRLVAGAPARISDLALATRLETQQRAILDLRLESEASAGHRWQVTLAPRTFSGQAVRWSFPAAPGARQVELPVQNPRLWWTWDLGRPDLYSLDVRLADAAGRVVDARRLDVGLREIRRDGPRFYLNGKKIFLRGTNVYANLWLSEMTRGRYEADFGIIRAMNVNILRVHCHFENPEFYTLADEAGLLVWQDFLEAWYPHDTAFSRHAAALYDNHIRLVRNHPSIAAWAASDEEDQENYRDLAKHLAARPALLDPQDRPVIRSTGRWDDAHLYHGWYGDSIWDYARMTEPLVTELGATALPAKSSLDRFLEDKWPIPDFTAEWNYHRLQLPEAVQAWGDLRAQSPEQLIAKSQDYAARLFQVALERARRRKVDGAGGIFHFFAIDFWPSVTMAAVDFYRVPTKVHQTVARSFAPVAPLFDYDRDHWQSGDTFSCGLWTANDTWQAYPDAVLDWEILSPDGARQAAGTLRSGIAEDSAQKAGDVRWKTAAPARYRLVAQLSAGGRRLSENVFEFLVD